MLTSVFTGVLTLIVFILVVKCIAKISVENGVNNVIDCVQMFDSAKEEKLSLNDIPCYKFTLYTHIYCKNT